MLHRGRKGEPKGFREPDLASLLDAAHQQLDGPIILVWNRLGTHTSARTLIAARSWLRAYRLPAYAPELNPTDKVWSALKRSMANFPARTATALARAVKNRLNRMQYHHHLVDGYFAGTGLSPPTPTRPDSKRCLAR